MFPIFISGSNFMINPIAYFNLVLEDLLQILRSPLNDEVKTVVELAVLMHSQSTTLEYLHLYKTASLEIVREQAFEFFLNCDDTSLVSLYRKSLVNDTHIEKTLKAIDYKLNIPETRWRDLYWLILEDKNCDREETKSIGYRAFEKLANRNLQLPLAELECLCAHNSKFISETANYWLASREDATELMLYTLATESPYEEVANRAFDTLSQRLNNSEYILHRLSIAGKTEYIRNGAKKCIIQTTLDLIMQSMQPEKEPKQVYVDNSW
jgi:hypothetical protein